MKAWATDIERYINDWSARLGTLRWWPKYVYHFTDVHNAASIIESGLLYSRAQCIDRALMKVDNASSVVLRRTNQAHYQYVRLYFRPRTPTQYNNEGIRPRSKRSLDAHCPIPIYFCFDALQVLSRDDVLYSDGNMGSQHVRFSGEQEFFNTIPFHYVFHDGVISSNDKHTITFHRNAEVLVPNQLAVGPALKAIVCRSVAERQTLLALLPPKRRLEWAPIIRIGGQGLFVRQWTFVEEVVVIDDTVHIRFNPSSRTPGPFDVRFTYQEDGTDTPREVVQGGQMLNDTLKIRVADAISGTARLYLDDALAFAGRLIFDDLPF
jgi:hypothetical protein